jgi:hypothetical protein
MIAEMLGMFVAGGLIGFMVSAVCLVLWILALVDCIKSTSLGSTEKIVWVLVIIFVPCLGPILYFFVGRKGGS